MRFGIKRTMLPDFHNILQGVPESILKVDSMSGNYDTKARDGLVCCADMPNSGLPLHAALERGHYDVASFLLRQSSDAAGATSHKGRLPLHVLFYDFQAHPPLRLVLDLIEAYPNAVQMMDEYHNFPLNAAICWAKRMIAADKEKTLQIVNAVFERFPEAVRRAHHGWTAFDVAILIGDVDLVRLLCNRLPVLLGASSLARVGGTMNPLYRTANNGNIDLFKFLLDGSGASQALMKSGRDGELPIHAITSVWYLRQDHIRIARLIIEHAPSTIMIKKKSKGGKRVLPIHELMTLSTGGNEVRVGTARLLIEYGPPEMLRTPADGYSYKCNDLPIHFAAEIEDNLPMVKLLTEAAPDTLAAQDGYGRLPIHRVPRQKGLQTMLYLARSAPHTLNIFCDKNPISEGGLPLHIAIECGMFTRCIGTNSQGTSEECFVFLLANSTLTMIRPGDCSNVLHISLEKNLPLRLFQYLVRSLRDRKYLDTLIKQQNKHGQTPLHYTNTTSEHIKLIVEACSESELREALLLKDSISWVGNTPLQMALEHSELWEEDTHHGDAFGVFDTRSYSKDTKQGQKKFENAFGIVKQFIKACPESLASKNVKRLTPVQIADKEERPPHVIQYLILADTGFNADTLVVACNHTDPSVCYEYLKLFPDVCAVGGTSGTERAHNDSTRGSIKDSPATSTLLVLTVALVAILVAFFASPSL